MFLSCVGTSPPPTEQTLTMTCQVHWPGLDPWQDPPSSAWMLPGPSLSGDRFPGPGGLCPLGPCPKRSLGSWSGSKFKVRATSRRLWCLLRPCPAVSCSPYLLRHGVETYLYWVTSSPKGFLWAMWSPVGGRCLPLPSLIHPLQPPHLKRINLIMFVS